MSDSRPTVWVLLRERSGDTTAHGVFATRALLDVRITKIGERNPQYPLRQMGENSWRIGPDEDEGFFGNKPIHLYAREVAFTNEVASR